MLEVLEVLGGGVLAEEKSLGQGLEEWGGGGGGGGLLW